MKVGPTPPPDVALSSASLLKFAVPTASVRNSLDWTGRQIFPAAALWRKKTINLARKRVMEECGSGLQA
ncbi:hypothetical protein SUGI_0530740 [Cryptomeria japonica]|nr:hypothetical protein SUGI_0530740 [Cryptomeria japonica]